MIEILHLKKNYGAFEVLSDINLTIERGEIYGLLGRSGEGKSTLLRCINGLTEYQSGSLLVDGVNPRSTSGQAMRDFRKGIGMIFQHFALLERKSVFENIALPMRAWKYDTSFITHRVTELLDLVGLADKSASHPRDLSGGQKQRVGIARALAMEPKLLLCDEATSALDPKTTGDILQLLQNINRDLALTMLVVTHEIPVIKQMCDRVSILNQGRLEVTSTVEKLFLDQPDVLQDLLGERRCYLPAEGTNLRLMFSSQLERQSILAPLAAEEGIMFRIIGGNMERNRTGLSGSIDININTADRAKALAFLEERGVECKTLPNGMDW